MDPKPYQFTLNEILILRDALSEAGVHMRSSIRESIAAGNEVMAGFYAARLVRNERAAHVAWSLSHQFPSAE
jgi:hypothetical protein